MESTAGPDLAAIESFSGRLITDVASAAFGMMSYLGDRLGIFAAMAGRGPMTAARLAELTGLSERHLREWPAMVAGEYVRYDRAAATYELPDANAAVLADATSPFFFGGVLQLVPAIMPALPLIAEAFRTGKGIEEDAFPSEIFEAAERCTAPLYDHLLAQALIPSLPGVREALDAGGSMLDVGCGAGRACLAVARAFPRARVLGYDRHAASIERARKNARTAGFEDRVVFDVVDCTRLPRNELDLITAFDVLHDAPDPLALLGAMRNALRPSGACLVQEFGSSGEPQDNIGPVGKLFYAQSAAYCLNVSLVHQGPGLGSLMGESKIRELASAAGFSSVDRLPVPHPVLSFYALRR